MAERLMVPKTGFDTGEAVLTMWLVDDGDAVVAGQAVCELETDKAEVEFEAPASGFLRILVPAESIVHAGSQIGWVAESLAELGTLSDIPASDVAVTSSQDVQGAWSEPPDAAQAPPTASESARASTTRKDEIIPMTGWRKAIANRLEQGLRASVPATTIREIDVTNLVDYRAMGKANGQSTASVTALLVKAAALALRDYPELNGTLEDDIIYRPAAINIAIAIDTDRGVTTPVLRNADNQDASQVDAWLKATSDQARQSSFSPDQLAGATFTVTTTGPNGADFGMPTINPPQIATMFGGRIRQRPQQSGSKWVARSVMGVSLTYDHRAVDGLPTVNFIIRVEELCSDPEKLLVTAGD
jgi:pyruvate/2-oxoglutarate dehydrogenase complex dihydrolipoamide acyltransferase (E2) component